MATILERFQHLGLAHNNDILSKAGYHVAREYDKQDETGRRQKKQVEDGQDFFVWNYPDHWIKELDRLILEFVTNSHTPK